MRGGSSGHSTPLRTPGNGSAQVHKGGSPGAGLGGGRRGRGLRASLPGSGLTQVRSCLQGLNQVTAPPGGRPRRTPLVQPRAAPAKVDRTEQPGDRDLLASLHLPRGAGPRRAPVRGRPTPLSPAPMDPPRCALRGGARTSQVPAGRGRRAPSRSRPGVGGGAAAWGCPGGISEVLLRSDAVAAQATLVGTELWEKLQSYLGSFLPSRFSQRVVPFPPPSPASLVLGQGFRKF